MIKLFGINDTLFNSNYYKLTIIGSDSDNNYFSNDYYYPYNANIYVGTPKQIERVQDE